MGCQKFAILLAVLLSLPLGARAVSLDGVLIYAVDDFGNPVGFDWDAEKLGSGLWRWETQIRGQWGGLGILSGLPPESLRSAPLNGDDFAVSIPLVDHENDFTLVGATGGGNDDYQRIAVNLFFDGIVEYPSISVLVPGDSPVGGGAPAPNRSNVILNLESGDTLRMTAETAYTDGSVTVSVSAASFRRYPSLDVDIVAPHSLVSDGTKDWVGVLRLVVEAANAREAPVLRGPVQPATGVNIGGEVRVGPDRSGGPQYGGGYGASELKGMDVTKRGAELDVLTGTPGVEDASQAASPSAAPTAAPTTPAAILSTPSPAATVAPTSGKQGTPTAASTPVPSAPTAPASPSVARTDAAARAAVTPSPAAHP